MKKSKIITWCIILLLIGMGAVGIYEFYFKEDRNSTLTLVEKQWIESNRNELIDFDIDSEVPLFSAGGEGILFDFLEDIEEDTKLEFNKVAVENSDTQDGYAFKIVDKKEKNDILLYQDNYALLALTKDTYYQVNDLKDLNIGVLKEDLKNVSSALMEGVNLKYQSFDTVEELFDAVDPVKGKPYVDAVVLPKLYYASLIGAHEKLNINYNIPSMTKDYVITLGKSKRLNNILKKYYTKWSTEEYETSFNEHFSNLFFTSHEIDEEAKSTFYSKRYLYGFVSNRPNHANIDGKLYGYNIKVLQNFAKVANIEFDYKEYGSYQELMNAFDKNEIDFFYHTTAARKYNIDTFETVGVDDAVVVLTSPIDKNKVVNSFASLKGETVATLADSRFTDLLKEVGAQVKTYRTLDDLIASRAKDTILMLDYDAYDYYRHKELENYGIDYMTSTGNYRYIIRDIKANRVFENYLDFYFSMVNSKVTMNDSIYTLLQIGNKPYIIKNIIILISSCLIILCIYFGVKKFQEFKRNDPTISKLDKLRYIDSLTSLKNRTYLNEHIEKWDNSEVYPQAIIIVDLNNIAYINDNYGHQEGDTIIKEAANILIKTQIENSDIIRTNGNEFLIYLVGYEEKQVITYIRKLNKEMKDLSHGYGAAVGYSMITDAIKTIDDAVNEATIDMRNNKEELNN